MAKLTLYPCLTKDASGAVTVTSFIDLLTNTTYTQAEVAAMNSCPLFDTEVKDVCYSVDSGVTVLPGGTLVSVYAIDPDTGLPNLTPIEQQLTGNDGTVLDLTLATVSIEVCTSIPDSEVREVCVDTDADGISNQSGLQHISYTLNTTTGALETTSILTELDATTIIVGGVVVDCPETFFGTPVEVCV